MSKQENNIEKVCLFCENKFLTNKKHKGGGFCSMHLSRLLRNGNPHISKYNRGN